MFLFIPKEYYYVVYLIADFVLQEQEDELLNGTDNANDLYDDVITASTKPDPSEVSRNTTLIHDVC